MNYFSDEKEWCWLFDHALDWEKLLPLYQSSYEGTSEDYKNSLKELLTATGEWAFESVALRAADLDREGAGQVIDGETIPGKNLKALYKEAKELGILAPTSPEEWGGLNLPASVSLIMFGQLARGCLASSTQVAFFGSIAEMIHRFCDEETAKRLVPKIAAGELSGAMALTEPHCGSDLGMISTSATLLENKTYALNGTKIFITNGGGGLNLVLARIKGAPEGLSGISLFLAEQRLPSDPLKLNFRVTKNEEKMGMHGSFTCEVVYENTVATLIGNPGDGLKQMLHLMNEARLATAFQALGGLEACLDYAHQYASERKAFGSQTLLELPLFKRNLEELQVKRDALRALLVDTLSHYDIFQKLDLKKRLTGELTKEETAQYKEAQMWSRKRTPLCKMMATELYTLCSQRCVQMLGGHGFMKDHPVERFHRDSFAPLLYEGTTQIQALTALKDVVRFAMQDPSRFFSSIFYHHPAASFLKSESKSSRDFASERFRFKRKLVALLIKSLRPSRDKIFNAKAWMSDKSMNKVMAHAETIAEGMAIMETLRVLSTHAAKDKSRQKLFDRYLQLSLVRLEALYVDWETYEF